MTVDPTRCPLCSSDNDCGMQRGDESCWCMKEPISARLLARVPAEAKESACVCVACVRADQAVPADK